MGVGLGLVIACHFNLQCAIYSSTVIQHFVLNNFKIYFSNIYVNILILLLLQTNVLYLIYDQYGSTCPSTS